MDESSGSVQRGRKMKKIGVNNNTLIPEALG